MAIREIECAGRLAEQRFLAVIIYFIIGSDFRAHQLLVKKSFAAHCLPEDQRHVAPDKRFRDALRGARLSACVAGTTVRSRAVAREGFLTAYPLGAAPGRCT